MALTFPGFSLILEQRCIATTALLHHTAQSTYFHFLMSCDSTVAIALAVHPLFDFQRRVCRNKLLEKFKTAACVMEKIRLD